MVIVESGFCTALKFKDISKCPSYAWLFTYTKENKRYAATIMISFFVLICFLFERETDVIKSFHIFNSLAENTQEDRGWEFANLAVASKVNTTMGKQNNKGQ